MRAPLLTFCIPTYNRADAVCALVRRILEAPSRDIEVVVSDNCSTDNTIAQLQKIEDSRLVILKNAVNKGAILNQVNVLVQGHGAYSILTLDKDTVNPKLIPTLAEFIRTVAPITGYCEYNKPVGSPPNVFKQGEDSLKHVAYSCHHPSGYFFRKDELAKLNISQRFTDPQIVGNFPFEFMQAELAQNGVGAIFNEPVFESETLEKARATKSFTINALKENAFFSPEGRLQTTLRFSAHIVGLSLDPAVQTRLISQRFTDGLIQATLGYRRIMSNESICDHYHIATKKVGILELFSIAYRFFQSFLSAINERKLGHSKISGMQLLGNCFSNILARISGRMKKI